jgi:Cu+-exporting ATPase
LIKQKKDLLIGGSIVESGVVKAQVTATGGDTVLSGILKMVQDAQGEKPPMQVLADKISAIFVPLVIGIATLTFIINFFIADQTLGSSLLRMIAVLVISCPCAMGLATPAAIAVGLGRAAKNGILFRNASSLESFKTIQKVVFDKTGTLTTGQFLIADFYCSIDEREFKQLMYSLEKFSNHPIGMSIALAWKIPASLRFKKIEELKGLGIKAEDENGNVYMAGSWRILPEGTQDQQHNVYLLKNDVVVGWVNVKDEIRPEAAKVISWLHSKGIKTALLSGDQKAKCELVAKQLGIKEVYAERRRGQSAPAYVWTLQA